MQAHLAILGFHLTSDVESGENSGKQLRHDFVVLDWYSASMTAASGEPQKAEFQIDVHDVSEKGPLALVGWVSEMNDPTPIQATGGML